MVAESQSGLFPRRIVAASLCLSLLANALLAIYLVSSRRATTPSTHVRTADIPGVPPGELAPAKKQAIPQIRRSTKPADEPLPFSWAEVESDDYRKYVANLRAIGCPETTIRDIVAADVNQLFAVRAAGIWKRPQPAPYWKKVGYDRPGPKQMAELTALSKEQSAVLMDLLGARISQQDLIDLVHFQFHGVDQELAFLPDSKRQAAAEALVVTDDEMNDPDEDYWQGRKKMFDRKMQLLAGLLSSSELDEFRLRNSPAAENLRMETQYFDCTAEEFKKLLDARTEQKNANQAVDLLNRAAAGRQARELFGDERGKEFERVSDMFYIKTRRGAEEQGLGIQAGEAAWAITRETREAAARIARETPLTGAEGKAQLDALLKRTRVQLEQFMGPAAARSITRDLRNITVAPPAPPNP